MTGRRIFDGTYGGQTGPWPAARVVTPSRGIIRGASARRSSVGDELPSARLLSHLENGIALYSSGVPLPSAPLPSQRLAPFPPELPRRWLCPGCCRLQRPARRAGPPPPCSRPTEAPVCVDGHPDAVVAYLLLHVREALALADQERRVRVADIGLASHEMSSERASDGDAARRRPSSTRGMSDDIGGRGGCPPAPV